MVTLRIPAPNGGQIVTANFGGVFDEHIAPYRLAARLIRQGAPASSM